MPSPRRRVYLHIGLHKTGTTYVQSSLAANREGLLQHGVLYPGGPGEPLLGLAAYDALGWRPRGSSDVRIAGAWRGTVDIVNASQAPIALLSSEHFALASPKQAGRVVESFRDADVHVIVTARDLPRVLVSAWQETLKSRGTWTLHEFCAAVRDPAAVGRDPARSFWLRQDLPAILARWEKVVPTERICVVTVPPAGSPASALLDRFAASVGLDAKLLPKPGPLTNEAVGPAGAEVLRRLNVELSGKLNQRQYDRVVKATVARTLAERTGSVRFSLPAEDFAWVHERGISMLEAVRAHSYPVVGDLAELEPVPPVGRRPDEVTAGEVLDLAITALGAVSERYAAAWWAKRRHDAAAPVGTSRDRMGSKARSLIFRGKRAATDLADRSPLAGKALGVYLKARSAGHSTAADR